MAIARANRIKMLNMWDFACITMWKNMWIVVRELNQTTSQPVDIHTPHRIRGYRMSGTHGNEKASDRSEAFFVFGHSEPIVWVCKA